MCRPPRPSGALDLSIPSIPSSNNVNGCAGGAGDGGELVILPRQLLSLQPVVYVLLFSYLCPNFMFEYRMKVKVLIAESCLILCNLIDYSPPGSSVHGIFQARILEWVVIPFSRGSSWPRDGTWVSCITSRLFCIWATKEAFSIKTKHKSKNQHFAKRKKWLLRLFLARIPQSLLRNLKVKKLTKSLGVLILLWSKECC